MHRLSLLLLLCLLTAGGAGNAWAAGAVVGAAATKEIQVKAAFLYNFTKFVDWPAGRFRDPTSPIVIGIWGAHPVVDELAELVKERQVNGRSFVVTAVATVEQARAMHILFVPAGEEAQFGDLVADLNGAAILTVGESERFASLGGIITFTREADKIRFMINLEASEPAGLKLSAQLLKLATRVRRKN